MKTFLDILQAIQVNSLELAIAGVIFFFIGYLRGSKRVKRLNKEIFQLENTLLDLSEEILELQSGGEIRKRA
jgi:hypothetical protein